MCVFIDICGQGTLVLHQSVTNITTVLQACNMNDWYCKQALSKVMTGLLYWSSFSA